MEDELPRRPRRKLITPVTGSLVAVIIAAGAFAGGVTVQKNRGTSVAGTARPGGFTGGPPGAQQTAGDGTTGTVTYAKGDVIYVKDSEGNTVKVKIPSKADVTRTAASDGEKIQPGDSVVVAGAANSKGTVTATTVQARSD